MSSTPPPAQAPLVLVRTKEAYRTWLALVVQVPRIDGNTIGIKIDELFLSLLERIYAACFASEKFERLANISDAIVKSDLLRFLLQLAWEQKILDHTRYGTLILQLDEVGRMLGGWKRMVTNKTPAR